MLCTIWRWWPQQTLHLTQPNQTEHQRDTTSMESHQSADQTSSKSILLGIGNRTPSWLGRFHHRHGDTSTHSPICLGTKWLYRAWQQCATCICHWYHREEYGWSQEAHHRVCLVRRRRDRESRTHHQVIDLAKEHRQGTRLWSWIQNRLPCRHLGIEQEGNHLCRGTYATGGNTCRHSWHFRLPTRNGRHTEEAVDPVGAICPTRAIYHRAYSRRIACHHLQTIQWWRCEWRDYDIQREAYSNIALFLDCQRLYSQATRRHPQCHPNSPNRHGRYPPSPGEKNRHLSFLHRVALCFDIDQQQRWQGRCRAILHHRTAQRHQG